MQSNLGDAPPMVKKERSTSPQPLKMQSNLGDAPPMVKKERSTSPQPLKKSHKKSLDIAEFDVEDDSDQSTENALVLYNPGTSSTTQDDLAISDNIENQASSLQSFVALNPSSRVLPSVGAFTVQCAACFKWRLIPTKEKYEEIRESILQEPFVCDRAREWRPDISCDDPADISQDGSRLWAIDKPNIAQPPPGWERLLRIRGEGSTKFADVYYAAPSGKRLRSMVEIQKYLFEHPEYIQQGVNLSQFSFQIPKPLQENYVRKRPPRVSNSYDGAGLEFPQPLKPDEVNPLSWAAPPTHRDLQIGGPGFPTPYLEPPVYDHPPLEPPSPVKKKATGPSSKQPMYRSGVLPTHRDLQFRGPGFPTPYLPPPEYEHPPIDSPPPARKKATRPSSRQQMYKSGVLPTHTDLQFGEPGLPTPYLEPPEHDHPPLELSPPAKKKATRPSSKQQMHGGSSSSPVSHQPKNKFEDRNASSYEL